MDGTSDEVTRLRAELVEVLGAGALAVHAPETRPEIEALWRWRDVVPLEHLGEAIDETATIGRLSRQWPPAAVGLHAAVKRAFDPMGLLDPGKKL